MNTTRKSINFPWTKKWLIFKKKKKRELKNETRNASKHASSRNELHNCKYIITNVLDRNRTTNNC